MKTTKLSSMLGMWKEVMEDEEGFRVIDFIEVHGDDLENLLHKLVHEEHARSAIESNESAQPKAGAD